jgi:nicotinamide mononucleotide adenylyltransferase
MIANDEEWEKFVPVSVSKIIKKINGVRRIKTISKTETKPQEY